MANEQLTIQKNEARLKVIGNSYPDTLTNSGTGPDLTMDLIDLLIDLGIELPDIDPGDWDDIDAIIGYDDDGNPILIYPDPDTGEIIEWPLDFPIDPLDWPDLDVVPTFDDEGLPVIEFTDPDTGETIDWPIVLPEGVDPEDWPNMDITAELDDDGNPIISFDDIELEVGSLDIDDLTDGYDLDWMCDLDITGLDSIAYLDDELKVHVDDLPTSIGVVFPPNKTTYSQGQVIDITGLYVYAYDGDGNVWRGTGKPGDPYRSGRVPNNELTIEPKVAREDIDPADGKADISQVNSMWYSYGPWGGQYWPNIVLWNSYGPLSVYFSGLDNQTPSPVRLTWNAAHKMYVGNIDINGSNPAPIYGPVTLDGYSLVPYGDEDHDSTKRVIVSWNRPGDGATLTTEFTINVKQHGGGGR